MLTKLAWRLFAETEKPWVCLIKEKYNLQVLRIEDNSPVPTASYIWRIICQSPTIFNMGVGKLVRNGVSTLFWLDRWVDSMPLQNVVVWPVPHQWLSRSVDSYQVEVSGWNWQELEFLLPHSTLLKLASIAVCSREDAHDLIAWIPSPTKCFTVKSAHYLTAGQDLLIGGCVWKLIWSLRVQERVKVFLWELTHARLFANEAQWQRGLVSSAECNCFTYSQTCLHVVRNYKESSELWSILLPQNVNNNFSHYPLLQWVEWNLGGNELKM